MANIEKHPKRPLEQLDQADFSEVPTRARSSHLIGRYIKNHRKRLRSHVPPVEERKPAILLRVEDLPAQEWVRDIEVEFMPLGAAPSSLQNGR